MPKDDSDICRFLTLHMTKTPLNKSELFDLPSVCTNGEMLKLTNYEIYIDLRNFGNVRKQETTLPVSDFPAPTEFA